jgi:hypothetical protein
MAQSWHHYCGEGANVLQRFRLVFAVLIAAVALPAYGQEVELGWKFAKDAKFSQSMKTKTSQTMKLMGQDVKQEQEQEFVFTWTVKDVNDKAVVLEQKIDSVNMTITIGSNKIAYNSKDANANENPLSTFFRPLIGSSFTVTLNPNTMKVEKVDGREDFVRKLTEANPQMATLLKVILSDEQLKQMAEPPFMVAPDKGKKVKPGDSWTRESKLAMGPIGSYDAKYTFTYKGPEKLSIEGKEGTYEKIEMKTDLTYKAPDPKEPPSQLPFKIEGGTLKATEANGTIYFDKDKGRVVKTDMKVKLDGKLNISVADQKADVELSQTQDTTTTTTDAAAATPAATPEKK